MRLVSTLVFPLPGPRQHQYGSSAGGDGGCLLLVHVLGKEMLFHNAELSCAKLCHILAEYMS